MDNIYIKESEIDEKGRTTNKRYLKKLQMTDLFQDKFRLTMDNIDIKESEIYLKGRTTNVRYRKKLQMTD